MTALEIILIVIGAIIVLGIIAAIAWPVLLILAGCGILGLCIWGVVELFEWLGSIQVGTIIVHIQSGGLSLLNSLIR
jgi:hypothetical protein